MRRVVECCAGEPVVEHCVSERGCFGARGVSVASDVRGGSLVVLFMMVIR